MGNREAVERVDAVLNQVERDSAKQAAGRGQSVVQDRTLVGMRTVMGIVAGGRSLDQAAVEAGVASATINAWRRKHPAFGDYMKVVVGANVRARTTVAEVRRREVAAGRQVMVDSTAPVRDRGSLTDFRMAYFGRPTPTHQQLAVEALEDATNLYVFIFGPPGMGKDTLAMDYAAWESAPDRTGKTVAWFMEAGDFSERRFGRLERYLIDKQSYDHGPSKTPGGAKPTRSLIDDYGPFKWNPEMVWADGTKVSKRRWTSHAKYFVQVDAPEQDPNLWATGIGGATYGSRIKVCVVSDAFTLENQKSPTQRINDYDWLTGTLDTRLDDDGRLIVLGTNLNIANNYERLEEDYTAGARVIDSKQLGTSTLTKYSNGVCVVRIQAIGLTEVGHEYSFWPEMFPLDDTYSYKGKSWLAKELDDERVMSLADRGGKLRRGLRGRRERSPAGFQAMYQQKRDVDSGGDFTDAVLDMCRDEGRSFGQTFAHEMLVIGVDPARRYGAAWVLLAVDRREKTVCLADYFFGSDLGFAGIKNRLVIEPITKWNPVWYCYETNAEAAILDDHLIKEVIDSSGVSVHAKPTGRERGDPNIGPGGISQYMRTGQFLIPYSTADDRARFELVKSHFKAWDSRIATSRTKPGQPGHDPDEICMACWLASQKAFPMLEVDFASSGIAQVMPAGLKRKYHRTMADISARVADQRRGDGKGRVRAPAVSAVEAIEAMSGQGEE